MRTEGIALDAAFRGELSPLQSQALDALVAHETGVFVAPPGIGKTVVAIALVARRQRSTLVLVNRRHLLDQWRSQLSVFLGVDESEIGQICGAPGKKNKPSARIDVAMVQALARPDCVDDVVAGYGHVIVDECHHASSPSFERVLAEVKARYVVGLTATPQRRDGHQAIMRMQLGPTRFEVQPRSLLAARPFTHKLVVRETGFRLEPETSEPTITQIYASLAADEARNAVILEDVISTLAEGRNPVVLTQRRGHVDWFAQRLGPYARTVAILKGGMSKGDEKRARATLVGERRNGPTVLVATGPYIGEGFDDAPLDSLFLAMPIAWKGTLEQYVGRLHGYRNIGYGEGELPAGFEYLAEEWPGGLDARDGDDEAQEEP